MAHRLRELLGDDCGQIQAEHAPLANSLFTAKRPLSNLCWLYPHKAETGSLETLMHQLRGGEIAVAREAVHTLQPWRAAAHLRTLPMACGVLPRLE